MCPSCFIFWQILSFSDFVGRCDTCHTCSFFLWKDLYKLVTTFLQSIIFTNWFKLSLTNKFNSIKSPAVKVAEGKTYLFKSVLISLLLHVHTYLYIMSVYHYSMDYMDPSPWSWLSNIYRKYSLVANCIHFSIIQRTYT